jgi:site-specific recombinase XerD
MIAPDLHGKPRRPVNSNVRPQPERVGDRAVRRSKRDKYREYEEACKTIRAANAELLREFETYLTHRGYSARTMKQHVGNIDFYINEYLLHEDAIPALEGPGRVGMYLGYWFIRKALWASAASIRSNAASIKKFYDFMAERKVVSEADVHEMKETIKEEMPDWVATVRRYDEWDGEEGGGFWGP